MFSRNVKPGMFGLGIVPKEVFLAYPNQFVFLTIRLVPGSIFMVAIDTHRKSSITGEWIYGINIGYFDIFVLFVVVPTSIFVS